MQIGILRQINLAGRFRVLTENFSDTSRDSSDESSSSALTEGPVTSDLIDPVTKILISEGRGWSAKLWVS